MSVPKAFISYSHDSLDHKKWVLELAMRLRNNGIDAVLDQWDLGPGDDIPTFMERNVSNCDFVILICTEKYVEKANAGQGGVGYEEMIVTSKMINHMDQRKFIPVVRQAGKHEVPIFIKSKLFIDFSIQDDYELNLDNLLRALHKAPIMDKPDLSKSPFTDKVGDSENVLPKHALDILKIVVDEYEQSGNGVEEFEIYEAFNNSRILIDMGIKILVDKGFVSVTYEDYVHLSYLGKEYALENKLINT